VRQKVAARCAGRGGHRRWSQAQAHVASIATCARGPHQTRATRQEHVLARPRRPRVWYRNASEWSSRDSLRCSSRAALLRSDSRRLQRLTPPLVRSREAGTAREVVIAKWWALDKEPRLRRPPRPSSGRNLSARGCYGKDSTLCRAFDMRAGIVASRTRRGIAMCIASPAQDGVGPSRRRNLHTQSESRASAEVRVGAGGSRAGLGAGGDALGDNELSVN
jgi:hypothetical protein